MVATNAVIRLLLVVVGKHPLLNTWSLEAASKALKMLREGASEETLVRFLISGGDPALFQLPIDRAITLDDLQTINHALVGAQRGAF